MATGPEGEQEELLRALAENIREVFWITSPDKDEMEYISPGYAEIWGESPEVLYRNPRRWLEAIHPDDRERVEEALPRQKTGDYDVQYRIVRPDGEVRWIHDRAYPVEDADGDVVRIVGIAEDVTEERRQEERLRTQRDQLEILNRLVSHDIRNDMAAMISLIELLIEDAPEDAREDLIRVRDTGRHVADLTETLRSLVDVIRRGREVEPEPVSLRETLVGEVRNMERTYGAADLEIVGEVPDVEVQAGPLLGSVFRNLLNNAVQHNPAERPVVELAAERDGDTVAVRVADDGPGMPEEEARRLEDEPPDHLGEVPDASMGLYLVRRLVDSYGGSVGVEDRGPEGTLVTIRLAVARDP